jgi:hypothetical protein
MTSLIKRELSQAELQQRRDAARARWEGHVAAGAAGAAVGAGLGFWRAGEKRLELLGRAKAVREQRKVNLAEAAASEAGRRDRLADLITEGKKAIGPIPRKIKVDGQKVYDRSTQTGMKGWPVPEYFRLLDRQWGRGPKRVTEIKIGDKISPQQLGELLDAQGLKRVEHFSGPGTECPMALLAFTPKAKRHFTHFSSLAMKSIRFVGR